MKCRGVGHHLHRLLVAERRAVVEREGENDGDRKPGHELVGVDVERVPHHVPEFERVHEAHEVIEADPVAAQHALDRHELLERDHVADHRHVHEQQQPDQRQGHEQVQLPVDGHFAPLQAGPGVGGGRQGAAGLGGRWSHGAVAGRSGPAAIVANRTPADNCRRAARRCGGQGAAEGPGGPGHRPVGGGRRGAVRRAFDSGSEHAAVGLEAEARRGGDGEDHAGADLGRVRLSSSRSGSSPVQFQQRLARRQARRAGRDHGQHLQRRGDREAGAPDVRDAAHVRGVGQIRDLERLGEAAGGAAVGLHDVGGVAAQQLGEPPAPELRLPGGYRNRRLAPEAAQPRADPPAPAAPRTSRSASGSRRRATSRAAARS